MKRILLLLVAAWMVSSACCHAGAAAGDSKMDSPGAASSGLASLSPHYSRNELVVAAAGGFDATEDSSGRRGLYLMNGASPSSGSEADADATRRLAGGRKCRRRCRANFQAKARACNGCCSDKCRTAFLRNPTTINVPRLRWTRNCARNCKAGRNFACGRCKTCKVACAKARSAPRVLNRCIKGCSGGTAKSPTPAPAAPPVGRTCSNGIGLGRCRSRLERLYSYCVKEDLTLEECRSAAEGLPWPIGFQHNEGGISPGVYCSVLFEDGADISCPAGWTRVDVDNPGTGPIEFVSPNRGTVCYGCI